MIKDLVLPQLAMGMSEGTLVEWLVGEGDFVERDVPLVSIETEKVVTDLPSPYRGYLHRCAEVGKRMPVEVLIAQITDSPEEYRQLVGTAPSLPTPASAVASVRAVEPITADIRAEKGHVRVSGLARKMAVDAGLDLALLVGSGPGGRIVRRDVLAATAAPAPSVHESAMQVSALPAEIAPQAPGARRELTRLPLTGMRKAIADRMLKSKTTAAHTYAFFELDITKLVVARQTMLAREKELGGRVSLIALYAKALALACQAVPICNATFTDSEIVVWDSINVGIAVALPGKSEYESGLIVPVVRDVQDKSVLIIDREIKTLIERAKTGQLTSADVTEGTVTLSSTAGFMPGHWCVSTPLINQPQVLNFQPGSPIDKPVVIDGQIVVRTMLPCGLSFDHRAMDGEPVGQFSRKIADLLTHPELMLV